MVSFKRYIQERFGDHEHDKQIVAQIDKRLESMHGFEHDIQSLTNRLSQGNEAVQHAANHFLCSLHALKSAINTAIIKNTNSPEMADHSPKTIEVS